MLTPFLFRLHNNFWGEWSNHRDQTDAGKRQAYKLTAFVNSEVTPRHA